MITWNFYVRWRPIRPSERSLFSLAHELFRNGSFDHQSLGYFLAIAEEQSGVIHGFGVRDAPYRLVRASRTNGMVYGNDAVANFAALLAYARENQPTSIEVMSKEAVDEHLGRHIQWQIWGILILIAITALLMVGFTMGGMEW